MQNHYLFVHLDIPLLNTF